MKRRGARGLLYAALFALLVLHYDFWQWNDPRLVLGLPIGFTYHILYAVAASILLSLTVTFAWPEHLDVEEPEDGPGDGR